MISLPPPIVRSWERCRPTLPPEVSGPVAVGGPLSAEQQQLLAVARSSVEDLYQLIERPGYAVLLADAAAVAVDLEGDPEVVALGRGCGLTPPALLAEECAGTNAVDLALREAQPCQTAGDEHYSPRLRPLALAAAPIFDPDGGSLGALAIVAPADGWHRHTLGLAIAAAQALNNQLRAERVLGEANDQLAELYATLETISEGLIFIGPGGEVRRINSRAAELLGVSARRVAGRPLLGALDPPALMRQALERRQELGERELIWQSRVGPLAVICGLRPVFDRGRRYLGALITLRPPQSLRQLLQGVVGAKAQFTFHDIVAQSPTMLQALHQARLAAGADGPLLLIGENGVGKEMMAQAIHNASRRAGGPFVSLSCASVPRPLLAAELFGVEGDPTRADQPGRPGRLELAHGGVLYLEEVGALPFELQTALLRTIEMGRLIRAGGSRPLPVDVRVIATGVDLERQVQEGRFRADLAALLSALSVEIPPLRRRGDDLLLLVSHFLLRLGERLGRQVALAPDALQALRAYHWPGNIRELELTLERVIGASEKSVIVLDDLPAALARSGPALLLPVPPSLADSHAFGEREAILRAGRQAAGHIGRTAALLGVSRATLWRKMARYGLSRDDFWAQPGPA